jgi:hypothetical protein
MGEAKRASVDDLIRAIKGTNPFQSNRVSSPNDVRVDVGQVHGTEFTRLTARIEQVRHGRAAGILVVGGPGTGKSHVLGRLARWAKEHSAAFVFLHNLQASPERMPRYVLKATISAVFTFQNGSYGSAGLIALLHTALNRLAGTPHRGLGGDSVDREIVAVLNALVKVSSDPNQTGLVDAAIDWMSGDEIDEDQARELGKSAGRRILTRPPDDETVKRVLIVLARLLALDDKVLVLCIDQIDNLDADQVHALMAFLHALIDLGENLAVICAGVRTSMYKLKEQGDIPDAAWDRVAEHIIDLQEISTDHARSLIAARTVDFLQPFAALKALDKPRRADSLFPLGEAWFAKQFGEKLQVRPRDAVSWARDQWERVQHDLDERGGSTWLTSWPKSAPVGKTGNGKGQVPLPLEDLIDHVVRAKVEECRAQRMLNPGTLPPDTDNLAKLTANLLSKCVNRADYSLLAVEPDKPTRKGGLTPYEFIITERNGKKREVRTGVTCLPGGHGNGPRYALERIRDDKRSLEHVVVVSDQRRPPRLGDRGKKLLQGLEQRGPQAFRHIPLSVEEVVELDALDSVLGLARVGDLEIEYPPGVPRPVSEPEAVESMHRLGLLVGHRFLRELLTEDEGPAPLAPPEDPLDDAEIREEIANYLSWRWGATATEVAGRLNEDHPDVDPNALHRQVIRVADMMNGQGMLQSTPQDTDRYLLWKGGAA